MEYLQAESYCESKIQRSPISVETKMMSKSKRMLSMASVIDSEQKFVIVELF